MKSATTPFTLDDALDMNDQGGFSVERLIGGMGTLAQAIRSAGARPVFLTSSPINNGATSGKLGGNAKLHEFAVALKKFAAE